MIGQVMKGKLEIVFPGEAHSADRDLSGAALGQEGVISCSIVGEPSPPASSPREREGTRASARGG